MKTEIKKIYTNLTGGKEISSDNQIVSAKYFNSIALDKFLSELKTKGIFWNGSDIEFQKLIANTDSTNDILNEKNTTHFEKKLNLISNQGPFLIGIDIQHEEDLPNVIDFWEETFYRSKFKNQEITYCLKKENPLESFCGIYACKEALIKCNNSLLWDEILINHDINGKPFFLDYNLSISHSKNVIIAIAIKINLEKLPNSSLNNIGNNNDYEQYIIENKKTLAELHKQRIVMYSLFLIIFIYLICKVLLIK